MTLRTNARLAGFVPVAAVAVLLAGFVLWWTQVKGDPPWAGLTGASRRPASFVGSQACAECHAAEAGQWRASQHARAMEIASEQSVRGDFSGAVFDYHGVRSRFFRDGAKYLVETDGADGKPAVFEIKYTYGLEPLQQYLVEFTGGRLQALSVAWDSRDEDSGGQRWFHLHPDEVIKSDDVLHWTKPSQNWNGMCAECHSTGVRKNYDAAADRFATTWSEVSVGCEACHGKGSNHVAWAKRGRSGWPFGKGQGGDKGLAVGFDERRDVTWTIDATTGNARRSAPPAALRKEAETCGLCHGRRGLLSEDWVPGRSLTETHAVSALSRDLFEADGQMRDEVYNYGSFKQSKMYAAGVTCADCHEPHGGKLRAEGEAACAQCHAPSKYAAAAHHGHEGVTPAPTCISCHMPERTYMVVDRRHDHSFRIPRPDQSAALGTSNACNDCHQNRTAEWAATAIERWHGPARKGFQTYAAAFHAAWTDQVEAASLLAAVASDDSAPAFARASALSQLGDLPSPPNPAVARRGLADPDPMVRNGALELLENAPPEELWSLVSPLLSDPDRGVRIRSAGLLSTVPAAQQPAADQERFARAADEFIAAQRLNADRPEARATLGNFLARRGQSTEAEAEYKAALRLSPHYAPAAINLADLYRELNRDRDAEAVLRAALRVNPEVGSLHHALGLALVRLQRPGEALPELRRAAELDPDRARYAYVYAIALHSAGRGPEATSILRASLQRHPNDRDAAMALVSLSREAGDMAAALGYAQQLARMAPGDPEVTRMVRELSIQAGRPPLP